MTVRLFAGGGPFRSQWVISQARGDFAGHFTGHFAAAKWECGAAKWHSCAKGVFRKGCLGCEMKLWRISQLVLQLQNGYLGCETAHVCLGSVLQLRNISQRVVLGLRNGFAEASFRLRNLADPCFSPILHSFLLQTTFL